MMKLDGLCEIIKKLESTRGQMNTSEYIGDIKISWLDIQNILILIDKEEPKEVIHKKPPYGYPFNTGKCPVCLEDLDENDQYCSSCGQHVSW